MNLNEKIKRSNRIKRIVSNSRAILTNQIDFTIGCFKMKNLINSISETNSIENIDLQIFSEFYRKMEFFPIGNEKEKYNQKYLKKLDVKIKKITHEYESPIFTKCKEIIYQLPE